MEPLCSFSALRVWPAVRRGKGGFRKGAIKAGMNGHIAKPTDEAVIRKHLEQIF
ncbi:hypothetical protein LI187_05520 [bacterium 210820-DFI.6.38]|nr:hypothetical protein [bacterium 210820-DFI.6.38]